MDDQARREVGAAQTEVSFRDASEASGPGIQTESPVRVETPMDSGLARRRYASAGAPE